MRAGDLLPDALAKNGYALRPQTDADRPFLAALYASVRAAEMEVVPWEPAAKAAFLAEQFRRQDIHYKTHYPGAQFLILLRHDNPVGRLYLYRGETDHRIIDISLLPQVRGQGVGGALLGAVMQQAAAAGKSASIHVEKFNPAQTLYRRLGFTECGESGPYWLMQWPPPQS